MGPYVVFKTLEAPNSPVAVKVCNFIPRLDLVPEFPYFLQCQMYLLIYIYMFFDANHFDCRLEQLAFKWLAYSGFGKLHGWLPTSWEKQSPKRQHEATVLNTILIFLITPSS